MAITPSFPLALTFLYHLEIKKEEEGGQGRSSRRRGRRGRRGGEEMILMEKHMEVHSPENRLTESLI